MCPSNQISSTVAAAVLGVASGAIYTWAIISDAAGEKIETLHPEGIQGAASIEQNMKRYAKPCSPV
jgi:hypothetical protein